MPVSATRVSGRAVSVQELPLMREIVSRQMRPCTLDESSPFLVETLHGS